MTTMALFRSMAPFKWNQQEGCPFDLQSGTLKCSVSILVCGQEKKGERNYNSLLNLVIMAS